MPRPSDTTVLTLSCAAQFLVVFDISVITVGLPSMQADLSFAPESLQWVVNAYTLAFAGLLLLGGRLADLYGQRRTFVGGLALFTVASLVGGVASTPAMLVAARAAQGAGAAVLAPLAVTMLTTTFREGSARTRALTLMIGVSQVGGALGNVLGGVMTEYLTWRSVLLVNVPIGLPLIWFGARLLSGRHADRSARTLDLPGALLATAGVSLVTFGFSQTHSHGWGELTVAGPLAGGLLALAGLVVVETRFAVSALIPMRLLGLPGIAWGNLAMLLAGASQVPVWYFLTLTMQDVLGYGPARTGLAFLPYAAMMILVGLKVTPWMMRRLNARVVIATGALVAAAGFWWQGTVTSDSGYVDGILGPAVAISIGGALFGTPLARTVTAGVPHDDAGAASGLMSTTKQFGAALGLALAVTIAARAAGTGVGEVEGAAALAQGYGDAFRLMALTLLLLAACTLALPAQRDGTHPVPREDSVLEESA